MRCSLILLLQFSIFCLLSDALASSERVLETRSPINVPSKTYRKTAENHHYAYKINKKNQVVGRIKLPQAVRQAKGAAAVAVAKTDADHILEKQFVVDHLEKHVTGFNNLKEVHEDLTKVVNHAKNLAPISASINRGKGAVTKHALQGKAIKEKKLRNSYMIVTYPTARRVAQKVDAVYAKYNIKTTRTADSYLWEKFHDAGLVKGNMVQPAASVGNSPHVSPGTKGKGKRKASLSGSPTPKGRSGNQTSGKKALGLKTTSQRGRAGSASSSSGAGSPVRKKTRTNTGAAARKRRS
ncbi:hypothetical protein BKA70DRAFT_1560449 [Coprinopsis sp. MPI-PUGE-AT-0042]|nr:hypothetical protein BKA70DRAFT_1560449 [Coprinopsis sp. MPI-PUGE-AT-0042]